MLRLISRVASSVLVAALCLAGQSSDSNLKQLYDSHQWFQLRDAATTGRVSGFLGGAVAYAFNDAVTAENLLRQVVYAAPGSEEAYTARELLTYVYWRAGRYRSALFQLETMLTMKPDAADVREFVPLMRAFARFPEQSVSGRRYGRLTYSMKGGNFAIPISVNGQTVNYVVDTGANVPLISAAEAKRRGLKTQPVAGGKLGDSMVYSVHAGEVACADQITVGGVQLRNVGFLVVPDERFADIPPEQRGVLGLPTLLALRTLRWSSDGTFEIAFPAARKGHAQPNLYFDGAMPVTRVGFGGALLDFALDTGATETDLYPRFAEEFPAIVNQSGQRGKTRRIGIGGTFDLDSVILPELTLSIGGYEAALRPARVLPKGVGSTWHYGNLGLDLLNRARTVTLDFDSMTLTLSK